MYIFFDFITVVTLFVVCKRPLSVFSDVELRDEIRLIWVLLTVQELTEEGIPFLMLFYHPEDMDTPERFRSIVASELSERKGL